MLKLKQNVVPNFLVEYIASTKFQKELWKRTLHIAFPKKINKGEIGECTISLPCLAEQEKIASFLTSIDNLISAQESNISILETYNKGLISKIFKQEIRFKDDNGNEFPDWEEKKLINIGMITTGTTPSTKNEMYYSNKYLWVTPTDIDGKEITNTQKKLSEYGLKKGRIVPANSVLVTCIASIGKNAILREMGSCNQQINAITPSHKYNIDFVYYLICFNENMLHINAGHGGMEILNKNQFSKLNMFFPCLEEQEKIANFLTSLDNVLQTEKNALEQLKTIKKGLLQQMFI